MSEQNKNLEGELSDIDGKHAQEVDALKNGFAAQQGKDKAAFESALAKEKLSGDQRAAKEAAFKAEGERKNKDLGGSKLAALDKKSIATRKALSPRHNENLERAEVISPSKSRGTSLSMA